MKFKKCRATLAVFLLAAAMVVKTPSAAQDNPCLDCDLIVGDIYCTYDRTANDCIPNIFEPTCLCLKAWCIWTCPWVY